MGMNCPLRTRTVGGVGAALTRLERALVGGTAVYRSYGMESWLKILSFGGNTDETFENPNLDKRNKERNDGNSAREPSTLVKVLVRENRLVLGGKLINIFSVMPNRHSSSIQQEGFHGFWIAATRFAMHALHVPTTDGFDICGCRSIATLPNILNMSLFFC